MSFNNHRANIFTAGIVLSISLALSMPLQAIEDDLFFEMPVVLSASRLEQPISETPIAITSIDREIIEASGARTIPEILRLVPGIIVGNSVNEWGEESKLVVTYHGHTDQYSKQMQVLIDGRSIYEPLLGGVNWNMLPINPEDIERIEVSRGPNAATFGSNSFLAVINIITRHASEDAGHYTRVRAGNHDIADLLYRFGGNNGDVDYRVTLSTINDNGLDARKNIGLYQHSNETVDNHDDISTGSIDYRIDYQINNKSNLTYQGGFGRTTLDINKNFSIGGITPVRESDTTNSHQFLKLETIVDNKNSYVVQYYYNLQNKKDQSISDIIQPGAPFDDFTINLDFGFKSERHNLEFTHFNQTTTDLRLIWGVSAQQDISTSAYWLTNQGTIRRETYRLFANTEWQMNNNNMLNFGTLVEDSNALDTEISPRLALIHKFNDKHNIRIGVSRAIRSPFISEEFGNTVFSHDLTIGGDPNIFPFTLTDQQLIPASNLVNETILSREIGYYGQFMNDKMQLNARLFLDNLNHLIHSKKVTAANDTYDGAADKQENLAATKVKGMELEFDFRPDKSLRYFGNITYLKIKSEDANRTLLSDEFENSAPDLSASLLAIKQFNEQYNGSIGFYYIGEMGWLDVPGSPANNYSTMDLDLSRSIRHSGSISKISLTLKNLLGDYNNYHHNVRYGPLTEHNLTGYIEYSLLFK